MISMMNRHPEFHQCMKSLIADVLGLFSQLRDGTVEGGGEVCGHAVQAFPQVLPGNLY